MAKIKIGGGMHTKKLDVVDFKDDDVFSKAFKNFSFEDQFNKWIKKFRSLAQIIIDHDGDLSEHNNHRGNNIDQNTFLRDAHKLMQDIEFLEIIFDTEGVEKFELGVRLMEVNTLYCELFNRAFIEADFFVGHKVRFDGQSANERKNAVNRARNQHILKRWQESKLSKTSFSHFIAQDEKFWSDHDYTRIGHRAIIDIINKNA